MGRLRPFNIRKIETTEAFCETLRQNHLDVPVSEDFSVLMRPVHFGKRCVPNALAVHPLEGADCDLNGAPTDITYGRYARLIAGGPGLVWFESTAFTPDGKSNIHQMAINPASVRGLKALVEFVDGATLNTYGFKPYKVLQLSHAGRGARDAANVPAPVAAFANPYIDRAYPNLKIVSDEYISSLENAMVEAAILAKACGFDAVDLKCCHNYIQRELLAAYTRKGRYGGDFENRTRFLRNVITKIKKRLGDDLDLAVRLNAYDSMPYPYGFGMVKKDGVMCEDLNETIDLMRMLGDQGVHLFNISTNDPRFSPRGVGFQAAFDDSLDFNPYEGVEQLLNATRRLKHLVPEATIVCTGLSWFERYSAMIAAGMIEEGWCDFAGFGRQLLADRDFFVAIRENRLPNPETACWNCDSCFTLFGQCMPTGCAIFDPAYQQAFQMALQQEKKSK